MLRPTSNIGSDNVEKLCHHLLEQHKEKLTLRRAGEEYLYYCRLALKYLLLNIVPMSKTWKEAKWETFCQSTSFTCYVMKLPPDGKTCQQILVKDPTLKSNMTPLRRLNTLISAHSIKTYELLYSPNLYCTSVKDWKFWKHVTFLSKILWRGVDLEHIYSCVKI